VNSDSDSHSEQWQWTVTVTVDSDSDSGQWTVDSEQWTVNSDSEQWQWTVTVNSNSDSDSDSDSEQWTNLLWHVIVFYAYFRPELRVKDVICWVPVLQKTIYNYSRTIGYFFTPMPTLIRHTEGSRLQWQTMSHANEFQQTKRQNGPLDRNEITALKKLKQSHNMHIEAQGRENV
jgi:hypothetical protein